MKTKRWQSGVLAGLLVLTGALTVSAQEMSQPEPAAAQDTEQQEQVIELGELQVVGSRVVGRSAQDSVVPVDILQGEDLRTYGIRDMDSLLSATVPSYNVNQHAISDAATLVRPANLRGLPPDLTLILVNGKRRHRSSVVPDLSWGLNDGSHAPDLGPIPAIALDRVEVLRDGASAQYGSDAIAGALNFVLKEDRSGLTLDTSWGQYYHGDGDKVQVAANLGLPLTDHGFANFSFEFLNADETSRSVQRSDARGLIEAGNKHVRRPAAQIWGAPEVRYDYKFFGNLGLDLEDINSRLYAFGNYAERRIEGGFFFRNPNTRSGVFEGPEVDGQPTILVADLSGTGAGCPSVFQNPAANYTQALAALPEHCWAFHERFPGGFTPRFGGVAEDWSITFGLRGELQSAYALLNGWSYDASASFGQHSTDFFMHNTINPNLVSLRMNVPTSYRPGGYREFDKVFNLDISRPFDLGMFHSPLNFAFGLEYREEEYEIMTGGTNSWKIDENVAAQGFSVGSNGFQGFNPSVASTHQRGSYGGYLDLEAEVIKNLTVALAGRYEDYEKVGDTLNGKASARWQFLENFAVRGSVSSGFRAPTVGQANFRKVSTNFIGGRLVEQGTLPPDHPVAVVKGGKPLQAEKSVNYSVGTVFNLGDLAVTVDYYHIKVQDRIRLTSPLTLTETDVDALLAQGVAEATTFSTVNFFTNDSDITTQGVDVVATYPFTSFAGNTLFTLVGNWNDAKVDSYNPNVIAPWLLRTMEENLPEFRFSLTADHTWGPWRLLSRVYFYDSFYEAHLQELSLPINAGERWLVDLELSYTFRHLPLMQAMTIAAGAENLFDRYPQRNPYATIVGTKYPHTSPYGFNGGFYYLRAGFEF